MNDLIKAILPPWALVLIVLGTIFLFLTKNAWNKVINESAIKIKNKIFNINRKGGEQQENIKPGYLTENTKLKKLYKDLGVKNIEDLYSAFETSKKSAEESKIQENNLFLMWRYYMFSYFNLFLVPRSKLVLVWLYNNPQSTKELLCLNILIPPELENKELESEAVFNAIISHNLIEKDSRELYKVSNIGQDYLKFSGLINQL